MTTVRSGILGLERQGGRLVASDLLRLRPQAPAASEPTVLDDLAMRRPPPGVICAEVGDRHQGFDGFVFPVRWVSDFDGMEVCFGASGVGATTPPKVADR